MTDRLCSRCGQLKPSNDFATYTVKSRRKDGSYRTWTGLRSLCNSCEKVRKGTEQHAKRATRGKYWLARTPEQRVAERKRECERLGRPYRSKEQYRQELATQKAGRARAERPTVRRLPRSVWVDRLASEAPDLWDASLPLATLYYRARYHLDHEFKAREIKRLHQRKNLSANGTNLLSDGSLTPQVIRSLFAEAAHCPYCTSRMRSHDKSLDHILPRSLGGWHSRTNVLVCCKSCNASKRTKTPSQWLAKLKPERRSVVAALFRRITGDKQPWLGTRVA